MTKTAKLFTTGGSQAVRLPKEFRFPGKTVTLRRTAKGVLITPHDDLEERRARLHRALQLRPLPRQFTQHLAAATLVARMIDGAAERPVVREPSIARRDPSLASRPQRLQPQHRVVVEERERPPRAIAMGRALARKQRGVRDRLKCHFAHRAEVRAVEHRYFASGDGAFAEVLQPMRVDERAGTILQRVVNDDVQHDPDAELQRSQVVAKHIDQHQQVRFAIT